MKLHHLRNVVAVVERGSLRAGAKHLGLAQPAVSRSIKELENELGVLLFERSKFGMTLTKAGEVFARRARGMQAEMQRTLDELEQFKGADRGTITLACSTATLLALMPSILRHFRRRYPDVRLKVLEGTFPSLESQIRDGIIDLYYGPVAKGFTDPALIVELLFENGRMIVGRRDHPLRFATSLADLVGAEWVTTPVAIDTDNEVNCVFEAAGLPPPRIAMQASSGMSIATIVATSDLLAPLPQQWLALMRSTGLLTRIPVRQVPNAPRICALRRRALPLPPSAEFLNDLAMRAAASHVFELERSQTF